ncbi:MAG TPA: multidrug transporter, partial [Pseudomonas sp.]|nr:multidrug transporter [Pseudomonas sp.]
MNKSVLSLALMAALSGCSLMPDYQRPDAPTPESWPEGEAYIGSASAVKGRQMEMEWQAFFRDPALRELIRVALENNRD